MGHKFNFEHVSFNRDDIVEMSNDELQKNIIKFKRIIREARTMGQDTGRLEVEYCYLDHERQMRQKTEKILKHHRRGDR